MTDLHPATPAIHEAATRLLDAEQAGKPCRPVRDLIDVEDGHAAYAVQTLVRDARISRGSSPIGRKIGLTSPAVQAQLGVDQPDFGVLFDDMEYGDADIIPMHRLLQPRVEAEIAFILDRDLVDGDLSFDVVSAAVGYAVAALEIVDSRIEGWDISFCDTVADNASAGLFVLGTHKRTLAEFTPREVSMSMTVTGQERSLGDGAACLGDPLLALLWLARQSAGLGSPLRAGEVVLSGALGPMRNVLPGAAAIAEISGLGSVSATFSTKGGQ